MSKKTSISSIGEFGLIEKIKANLLKGPFTRSGPGDDCAVISPQNGEYLVSTDTLVEGIHFDNSYMSLEHVGYKSVVSNVSDIFAMNGTPLHITVSIGVSEKYSVEDIENLYSGINKACSKYNVDVIGGDISSSFSGLVVTITIVGHQEAKNIVYRSGAQENDLIVVSGNLGSAYLGLQVLLREKEVFGRSETKTDLTSDIKSQIQKNLELVERQIKPEARKDVINYFKENKIKPTSMIDVSDGLSSDLLHLARSSNVSVCIYENKIPISKNAIKFCDEISINPTIVALSGGEDYELLFTINQRDFNKIKDVPGLTIIGKIGSSKKTNKVILSNGDEIDLEKIGWDHFSAKK